MLWRAARRPPRRRLRRAAAVPAAVVAVVLAAAVLGLWGTGLPAPHPAGAARHASAASPVPPPSLTARAAVLLDPANGAVLYAKNPRRRVYPASTTKILTALVALTRGHLDSWVTVSTRATLAPGSTLGLRPGDRLRLVDLLYGMMLSSGNDAAEAVAEHIAGSARAFAQLMNQQAAAAGAADSHFTNPSGLPDPDLYTTALDMARITRGAMAIPLFARMVATRSYTIDFAGGRPETVYSHNRLLGRDGVDGVKTGYTEAAGHTYVASARRGGHLLLATLFGDTRGGKYLDALALFHYGFSRLGAGPAVTAAIRGPDRSPVGVAAAARRGAPSTPPAWPDPLPGRLQSGLQ